MPAAAATRQEIDFPLDESVWPKVCAEAGLCDGAKCRFAADQFYEAVRQHGHKAYRTTTSTVCEFDWTPPSR